LSIAGEPGSRDRPRVRVASPAECNKYQVSYKKGPPELAALSLVVWARLPITFDDESADVAYFSPILIAACLEGMHAVQLLDRGPSGYRSRQRR